MEHYLINLYLIDLSTNCIHNRLRLEEMNSYTRNSPDMRVNIPEPSSHAGKSQKDADASFYCLYGNRVPKNALSRQFLHNIVTLGPPMPHEENPTIVRSTIRAERTQRSTFLTCQPVRLSATLMPENNRFVLPGILHACLLERTNKSKS